MRNNVFSSCYYRTFFPAFPVQFFGSIIKQYNNDPLIKKTQIVNLRILTQTFVPIFLDAPHESHRHEAKLLEMYAGEGDKRKIFREEHNPYPYYVCALIWYMFEKYFREEKIDSKYKPYRAHLYLIFRYSLGEFPPKLINSKALKSYCDKLLHLLKEPQFEIQIKKVLEFFDATQKNWLALGESQFGIKDSKKFTDLLLERLRNRFIQNQLVTSEDDNNGFHEGTILRIIWKSDTRWFGFIKRRGSEENLYFDDRNYRKDPNKLVPHMKVRYKIGTGSRGDFATNIEVIS